MVRIASRRGSRRIMSSQFVVSFVALVAVLLLMLAEQQRSLAHERALRRQGAVEPSDDVYPTMRWAYPAAFVVMAVEGAFDGPSPGMTTVIGAALLVASKTLKFWAIRSLGPRWTFRVLVPPGAPLVTSGPYAFLRHPNYVAVIGELMGMAITVGARVTGPVVTILVELLLVHRIRVENSALRRPPRA